MTSRLSLLVVCLLVCTAALAVPVLPVEVVGKFPHDRHAFTQGLVWHDGRLYESTGLYGRSSLREVELRTGRVLRRHDLDRREFGEGITILGNRIYQLTWINQRGYVYDLTTFEVVRRFRYRGEGWGLTTDGERLYMSDGSDQLRILDPTSLRETSRIAVTANGVPVEHLNELQYIEGRIYANVWLTTRIAIINPESGSVEAYLDLEPLFDHLDFTPRLDYESPNGVTFDPVERRLFVTGKLWPWLFEIRMQP